MKITEYKLRANFDEVTQQSAKALDEASRRLTDEEVAIKKGEVVVHGVK